MIVQRLRAQAAARPRRVLLPEAQDPRVIQAGEQLAAKKLAVPVFLTDATQWQPRVDEFLDALLAAKGATEIAAAKQEPLMRAAVLLRLGFADAVVTGSIATTAHVLRCGLRGVGLAPDSKLVSSVFLMDWRDRVLSFADCAVVPDPDPAQLAHIAITSAASHQRLTGETPRVALLSFSTHGSASHARANKVIETLKIARNLAPDLAIDGELQFDAALVPTIGTAKAPGSKVAGQANVFIFPDLDAGNIGYKIAERLGGANAIGPILQGLAKPWMDLSRGCKVDDIVNVAVIASLLAL
jgi:phosphate acetyltransferase